MDEITCACGPDNASFGSRVPVAPSPRDMCAPLCRSLLGCFWCTTLYDLYLTLVDKYGFDEDLYTGTGGNNRWLLLVTDGMKLQPCRPTMVTARDAIIESNQNNFGGADECDIWAVFARRGLGVSASSGTRVVDGFDVPASC